MNFMLQRKSFRLFHSVIKKHVNFPLEFVTPMTSYKHFDKLCKELRISRLALEMYDVSVLKSPKNSFTSSPVNVLEAELPKSELIDVEELPIDANDEFDYFTLFNEFSIQSPASSNLASFSVMGLNNNIQNCITLNERRGTFGLPLLMKSEYSSYRKSNPVIITDSYWNALMIYSATGFISVVIGDLHKNELKLLAEEKQLYVWFRPDPESQLKGQEMVDIFGDFRVKNVAVNEQTEGPKNVIDMIRNDIKLQDVLESKGECVKPFIKSFQTIRNDIKRDLFHNPVRDGMKSKTIPKLNEILGGWRLGELTIFTGHTGTGKTTILSQLSLDFCMQGMVTLWCSFEVRNIHLVPKMMVQMTKNPELLKNSELFDRVSLQFQELPMYFLDLYGSTNFTIVKSNLMTAVEKYKVQHIVIDNLQFMSGELSKGGQFDRFEMYDRIVAELRILATLTNTHITIVIHPRKEDNNQALKIASVQGTAKATQEADNVIILQRDDSGVCSLEIKKNRFKGKLGSICYQFDSPTSTIIEISDEVRFDLA